MSIGRKLGRIAASSALYLVGFAAIGGIGSVVFDIMGAIPMRSFSSALYYVLWCVLGIFCGLLSYDSGGKLASPESPGDWTSRDDAGKTGLIVVLTESFLLLVLFLPFYLFMPGSISRTLTFFLAIFASVVFGHLNLRSKPHGSAGPSASLQHGRRK